MTHHLPSYIAPMLAKVGTPFDSDEYLFEVKWDGTRTLAFLVQSGYRLLNRRKVDMSDRYPEFAYLAQIEPGTVLDGEVVVLNNGKADFSLLMSREQARSPFKIRNLSKTMPATFVVFDLLFDCYHNVMNQPLVERRERLRQIVKALGQPSLVMSEGIVGHGKALFQEACAQNLEGVMAKAAKAAICRANGPTPGSRSNAAKRWYAWSLASCRRALMTFAI